MTPIAKALGSALVAMILGVVFSVFSCTRSDSAKSAAASCKGRVADVATYMEKFKDANVLTTDVPVPPDESKAPKALAYDAKRRILECDAQSCRLGSSGKMPYDANLKSRLATALKPGGKACGPVYLALAETLPPAKIEAVLSALSKNACTAFAVTRSSLKKLPRIEPSPAAIAKLKKFNGAKTEKERQGATKSLVDAVLKPHPKACVKTQRFLTTVGKAQGYEKFKAVTSELNGRPRDFEPCVCALQGQDDKVLFQVAGFNRLGGTLFVYSAKKLTADAMARSLKGMKSWYDFVRTL